MKRVLTIFVCLAITLISCNIAFAKTKGYDNPKWLYSTTDCITITNVEFTDTATILSIHEKHIPTWWVLIYTQTCLIDQDKNRYNLIKGEGIKPGELFITPMCGYADFKLYFEPMPQNTQFFDYIAGYKDGDFRIYGVHNADNPINTPELNIPLDIKDFENNFYCEGNVTIRGKIDGYNNNMGFKTILLTSHSNIVTQKDTPITIKINEDGTFQTTFKAKHPKFELIRIDVNNQDKFYYLYTHPGCTTIVNFDKEMNLTTSSPNKEVWECNRMINNNIFTICLPSPYMVRHNLSKNMSFSQFGNAIQQELELKLKIIDYIAWRDQFTPLEKYYAKIFTQIEYSKAIFEYYYHIEYHINDKDLPNSSRNFFKKHYKEDAILSDYTFLKQAPYNDLGCFAIPEFNFLINRYEYSKLLCPELYVQPINFIKFKDHKEQIEARNKKIYNTDMAITQEETPSLWARLMILRKAKFDLEVLSLSNEKLAEKYYKTLIDIAHYPILINEVESIYDTFLKEQNIHYKEIPMGEAKNLLNKIIGKYQGKFVL